MKVQIEVLEQATETFPTKRGETTLQILVCIDRTPEGRLVNTFDYVMTKEEFDKWNGKASGKMGELVIKKIDQNFANRLRCEGAILQLK